MSAAHWTTKGATNGNNGNRAPPHRQPGAPGRPPQKGGSGGAHFSWPVSRTSKPWGRAQAAHAAAGRGLPLSELVKSVVILKFNLKRVLS